MTPRGRAFYVRPSFSVAASETRLDVYVNHAQHSPHDSIRRLARAFALLRRDPRGAGADRSAVSSRREIAPHIDHWEADGELPRELHRKAAEAGILGLRYPEQYGGHSEGFDIFHGLTQTEELAAVGAGGLEGASLMTHGIGLPPVLALGSEEMKQRVAPPVLAGEKIIALGITEAFGRIGCRQSQDPRRAGRRPLCRQRLQDVHHHRHARRLADLRGAHRRAGAAGHIAAADRDGCARRDTHPARQDGLALFGYARRSICRTCKVPAANLIGPENGGFIGIMRNFNSERLGMAMGCCAFARVCLKEAVEWAQTRETFGKALVKHQSIRIKLADMARRIEATPGVGRPVRLGGEKGKAATAGFRDAQGAGNADARDRRARGGAGLGRREVHYRHQGRTHLSRGARQRDRRGIGGDHARFGRPTVVRGKALGRQPPRVAVEPRELRHQRAEQYQFDQRGPND